MVYLRGRCTTKGLTDLDEADPRPYVRLAARLRRQILDGEVAPGQRVPSITALSQESGHARQTCGKAMQLLEREELLRFIHGAWLLRHAGGWAPSPRTHDVRCG